MSLLSEKTVTISYTNHRSETAPRRINVVSIWFGKTEWHPEPQWLLKAFDIDKGAERDFAMLDISAWQPFSVDKPEEIG